MDLLTQTAAIKLSDLTEHIRRTINKEFRAQSFWVMAEISQVNIRKGHCYLNLIEKDQGTTYPKAEIRAIIWSSDYIKMNRKFSQVTGFDLKKDIKILILARVDYSNAFGLSLYVLDLDPAYTIGQLFKEREDTIRKLREEGIFDMNRKLPFPHVPQRIAVISALDSRGFEDFQKRINENKYGYRISIKLFESLLQGDKAARNAVDQLRKIFYMKDQFDLICLIRGGGGNVNLACFNDYNLSKAIARIPIPVLTGIGHSADRSVVDEVAHFNLDTPTAVADFIIQSVCEFETSVNNTFDAITGIARRRVEGERRFVSDALRGLKFKVAAIQKEEINNLQKFKKQVGISTSRYFGTQSNSLSASFQKLKTFAGKHFLVTQNQLQHQADKVRLLDPANVLKRGFSITYDHTGKAVRTTSKLEKDQHIKTQFATGEVESTITVVKNKI